MASIPDHTLPFNALDDYSFNLAIYELQHGPVRYDPERLSSLNYDPLFSSHNLSLTRSDDIDPDVNFCTDDVHCDYYIEDKFNEMLRNDNLCDEDFSLLHLNIRSLQRNLNSLSILLTCLNIKFSLIGVSETWLNDYSTGGDNFNKGCLGSPMNNFMSSRRFGRPFRIFRWHSPCLMFNCPRLF